MTQLKRRRARPADGRAPNQIVMQDSLNTEIRIWRQLRLQRRRPPMESADARACLWPGESWWRRLPGRAEELCPRYARATGGAR